MKLRIAQISDTHLGELTKMKSLRKMFEKLARERFDMLLHNGDYCGGFVGHRSVRSTVRVIREILGNVTYVSNIGNHELWHKGARRYLRPSLEDFETNYQKIIDHFRQYNVHFLEEDGPYRNKKYPGLAIVGHTGWYSAGVDEIYKKANDFNSLPLGIEGETHLYLQKKTLNGLMDNLGKLTSEDKHIVFSSHFPVTHKDFNLFYWHNHLAELMKTDYNCRYFFNGHAHERHEGPERFECGSHYGKPRYQIVELEFKDS